MNERIIEDAQAYIKNVFKNNADGHDANHSIRVYKKMHAELQKDKESVCKRYQLKNLKAII